MDNREELLHAVHGVLTETIRELDRVCRKHGLHYWMYGGSLLGTIRHKGFIPWDDDIDVGMMREDFERLLALPAEEWKEGYLLCGPESADERHDKMFGRLYIEKSRVQSKKDVENWRNWSDNKSWSTSLMCDIFIFDHVPEDYDQYFKLRRKSAKQKRLYQIAKLKPHTDSHALKDKVKYWEKIAASKCMRTIWKEPWAVIAQRNQKMLKKSKGSYVGTYYAGALRGGSGSETYPEDVFFPLQEADFEGMKVYVPNQWDKILSAMYGDYMTPPPASKRIHMDMIYLDLGDGKPHVLGETMPGSLGDSNR
ncbi:MAG: LicD family protein [Lachnospiraceae bacterium]|nr:LicD family protein [Lachnospiraceae bacterium]